MSWKWYYYPSGRPATNLYVTLQRSKNGGGWTTIGSSRTNALGNVYFTRSESSAGTYRYRTVAGGTVGTSIFTVNIGSGGVRTADFSASPTSGAPGVTIRFTDKSTATPVSWKWEFGDGTTSTMRNPSHKYTRAGTFTVKLTVKYPNGQVLTRAKSGLVRVTS